MRDSNQHRRVAVRCHYESLVVAMQRDSYWSRRPLGLTSGMAEWVMDRAGVSEEP